MEQCGTVEEQYMLDWLFRNAVRPGESSMEIKAV